MQYIAGATSNFLHLCSDGENIGLISKEFAKDIIETRPDWKVDEIDFFFKFCRQRRDLTDKSFGNKITLLKLMDFVFMYEDYRSQERELLLKEKRLKEDPNEPFKLADEPIKKQSLSKIYDMLKPEYKIPVSREFAQAENVVQGWMKEFDHLYSKNGIETKGQRFIKFEGKKINIDGYLNLKLAELK